MSKDKYIDDDYPDFVKDLFDGIFDSPPKEFDENKLREAESKRTVEDCQKIIEKLKGGKP